MHLYDDPVYLDIACISKELALKPEQFRPLKPVEGWQDIEANIYKTFVILHHYKERPVWLWEYFKLEQYAVQLSAWPIEHLNWLIDPAEKVWFFVNGEKSEFWFYEGYIEAITRVIRESVHIDEFYVCSKKYKWLLAFTHHDVLVATGNGMPEKLKSFQMYSR